MTDDEYFARRWRTLSQMGWCDDEGGMEFFRVFNAWLHAGRPTAVYAFIRRHANFLPGTPNFVKGAEQ